MERCVYAAASEDWREAVFGISAVLPRKRSVPIASGLLQPGGTKKMRPIQPLRTRLLVLARVMRNTSW